MCIKKFTGRNLSLIHEIFIIHTFTKILKKYSSFINIKILDKYKKYEIQTFYKYIIKYKIHRNKYKKKTEHIFVINS